MKPRAVPWPTLLLWVLIALLPLRSWASGSMAFVGTPGPVSVSAGSVEPHCHGDANASSRHAAAGHGEAHDGTTPLSGHHGACQACDLCHSPPMVARAGVSWVELPMDRVLQPADAQVAPFTQQPGLRPPRR